jgi:hypothetical protein
MERKNQGKWRFSWEKYRFSIGSDKKCLIYVI